MVKHAAAAITASEVARILRHDGCMIIDNLAEPELMDQILSEMQPYLETSPIGSDRFTGFRTRRTGGLIARSQSGRKLVQNPKILKIVAVTNGPLTSSRFRQVTKCNATRCGQATISPRRLQPLELF